MVFNWFSDLCCCSAVRLSVVKKDLTADVNFGFCVIGVSLDSWDWYK